MGAPLVRRVLFALFCSLAASTAGCGPNKPGNPGLKDPPQVFLSAAEANVVAPTLKVTTAVVGCDAVELLELREGATVVKTLAPVATATVQELLANELGALYPSLGIAANLALVAHVRCADGRENSSPATGVRFFPVEQVIRVDQGQVVPDTFIAEGGTAGSPTTFIGCIGVSGGTALARVRVTGEVLASNASLPFPCSSSAFISAPAGTTGKRWLMERGVGVLAFEPDLTVTSFHLGKVWQMAVLPSGDAVVWNNELTQSTLQRISGSSPPPNALWSKLPAGIVLAPPQFRADLDTVSVAELIHTQGAAASDVAVEQFDLTTGQRTASAVILSITTADQVAPTPPPAAFNASGTLLYFAYQTLEVPPSSRVMACASDVPGCTGQSLRWQPPTVAGVVRSLFPFAKGSQLAAVTPEGATFFDEATGKVSNLGGKPIRPAGSQVILEVQPGNGTDFFLLDGPANGYPTEVVAIDAPARGELYRYDMGGGSSITDSLTLAVDDGNQAWLRLGTKLVKPLPLTQYRAARGPTSP